MMSLHSCKDCTIGLVQEFLQLAVTDREQRLLAIQERFDGLRQARLARAAGDYKAMMRTGFVCRKLRTVGSGARL
jgi:hypothetical protein